jgi:hypothetical protein
MKDVFDKCMDGKADRKQGSMDRKPEPVEEGVAEKAKTSFTRKEIKHLMASEDGDKGGDEAGDAGGC